MEASQEIVLKSMERYGVTIPSTVSCVAELTPSDLVSICAQCLNLIHRTASFPTTLPSDSVAVADSAGICTEMASAVKNLGYVGDISFHKFLYPSEEDLYKLTRFLAEKVSGSSESGRVADHKTVTATRKLGENNLRHSFEDSAERADDAGLVCDYLKVQTKLNNLGLETQEPGIAGAIDDTSICQADKTLLTAAADDESSCRMEGFNKDEQNCIMNEKDLTEGQVHAGRGSNGNEETAAQLGGGHVTVSKQQEKELVDEVAARTSELELLERELELMMSAADMAFNNHNSYQFYLDQLNEQLQAKRHHLLKLESEWDAVRKPLEERRRNLEDSLYSNNPDAQEMLQKLRECQQEEQVILSEIRKREEEQLKLTANLEKLPKLPSRKSYTQRIKEITKNSCKQDADIERILKETREVQLESNSLQERLHRTYAVADEIVFREAKKDQTGRQVYRLLTNIHEGFEQMSEKILATDRIRREVAEYEMKLATMTSTSLNGGKLEFDVDVIFRENDYLEHPFQEK